MKLPPEIKSFGIFCPKGVGFIIYPELGNSQNSHLYPSLSYRMGRIEEGVVFSFINIHCG